MPAPDLDRHHLRTRTRGVNTPVLALAHLTLRPLILLFFRLSRTGRPHIPRTGPVIIAANHRSFLDPFAIACCMWRPVYFVAKREVFRHPVVGWILNALGAFPVRRGESDEEMMATAKQLLARGEVVLMFPEGTRIRSGSLARPKRGVGRLALETGAPVVPVAITGSCGARRGWRFRPVKVRIRIGRPLTFPRVESPSPHLAAEVTERIWPCVGLQWEWLGGLPPMRKAAVVGAGAMGTAVAVLLQRAGLDVQLGCRSTTQAEVLREARENRRYLPGVGLGPGIEPTTVNGIEFAGVDLVVLAVPSRQIPQAVGQVGAEVGERSSVLVLSKGLVAPLGTTPTRYVAERMKARAVACLGGPAHAAEAVADGAAVVLASADPELRDQLSAALAAAGLEVEASDDVVGTELAGCAKNAAALAAAAAAHRGPNAAGAAAGRIFAEVDELARQSGARPATLAGLAGVGDLVGTVLAEGSRNRRAGELLGRGQRASEVETALHGAAEAMDTVPLLAAQLAERGLPAPATAGLERLIDGRITADQWVDDVRSASARAA